MKVRPSVIISDGDKVLLMKYNYGGNEVYALPGGNPDSIETLEETLVREVQEELNLCISVSRLLLVGEVILSENNKSTLHCIFLAHIQSGKPVLNPEQTTALGVEWVEISTAEGLNLYPNVGKHIGAALEQTETENIYVGRIQQNWF